MIVAIYARKSTDQSGVADEQKSVARQIEHARHYAERNGWTVRDEHVYTDDGISGAEFANRPGFLRLMNALKPRPPFQVLIMSEESRLGREAIETAYAIKQLVTAGVRVFFYLEDRERKLDSPTDKIMLSLTTFADEVERERARQRTDDAMVRKAKAGHVTGGRVFGYDNVRLNSHVERRINDVEAAIVREIYERYALGEGFRVIAHALNAKHTPTPRAQRGRPNGWDPGTIRAVLERPLYRGHYVWGETKKRDKWGRLGGQKKRRRPENEVVKLDVPQLRIVSETLAATVDQRRADRRSRFIRGMSGQLLGRPSSARYLLSGYLRCACGAAFEGQRSPHGRRPGGIYVCSARRRKGPAVCSHDVHLDIEAMDAAFLGVLEGQVLGASLVQRCLDGAYQEDDRTGLTEERDRLEAEIRNLTAAVAGGADFTSLAEALRQRETRLRFVKSRLERPHPDREELRAALEQRIADWRRVLRLHVTQARQVISSVIEVPISIHPPENLAVQCGVDPNDRRGVPTFAPNDLPEFYRRDAQSGITVAADRDHGSWSAFVTIEKLVPWARAARGCPDSEEKGLVQRMASPTGFEPVS